MGARCTLLEGAPQITQKEPHNKERRTPIGDKDGPGVKGEVGGLKLLSHSLSLSLSLLHYRSPKRPARVWRPRAYDNKVTKAGVEEWCGKLSRRPVVVNETDSAGSRHASSSPGRIAIATTPVNDGLTANRTSITDLRGSVTRERTCRSRKRDALKIQRRAARPAKYCRTKNTDQSRARSNK